MTGLLLKLLIWLKDKYLELLMEILQNLYNNLKIFLKIILKQMHINLELE